MDRLEIKIDPDELCDVVCETEGFARSVEAIGSNESTIEEIVDRRLESHSVTRLVREIVEDEYGNILREDDLERNGRFIDAVVTVMDGTVSEMTDTVKLVREALSLLDEYKEEIKDLKAEVKNLKEKSF